MVDRNSAAFIILVIAIGYLLVNFLITVMAPTWSGLLASDFFVFTTSWGQDYGSWQEGIFNWLGLFSLIALFWYALIRSRRATT